MTKTRPSGNRVIELTFRGAVCDPVVANVAVFGSKISADASGVASSPPNAMPPATNTRPSARRMAWKIQPFSCIGPAAANLPVFGSKISAVAGAGPLAPVASGAAESPPRRRTRPSRRRTVVGPPRFPTISPVAFQAPVFGFQISAEHVAGSAPSKRTRPSASPIRASPYGSEPTSVEPSEAIAPGAGVSPHRRGRRWSRRWSRQFERRWDGCRLEEPTADPSSDHHHEQQGERHQHKGHRQVDRPCPWPIDPRPHEEAGSLPRFVEPRHDAIDQAGGLTSRRGIGHPGA